MEYHVICGGNEYALSEEVKNFIKMGWEPHGSLAVARDENNQLCLFQAVTRKEKKISGRLKTAKPAFEKPWRML